MKGVIIKYLDGRVEKYKMLYDAAWACDLPTSTFRAMAAGVGRKKMSDVGIAEINIDEHGHGKDRIKNRKRRRNIHFMITDEATGDKHEAIGFKDVMRITGLTRDMVRRYEGDGEWHHGWKIDADAHVAKIDQYPFRDPVDAETIELIRRYARQWLTRIIFVPDIDNVIAFIVAHVASDVSCGLYAGAKCSFRRWLYGRVRRWGSGEVTRAIKVNKAEQKVGGDEEDDGIDDRFGHDDGDARESLMYSEMPEDLREVARCIDAGMINAEIQQETGLSDAAIIDRRRRLAEWLRARVRGD